MILEEFIGTLVSLGSLLITPAPSISRENLRRHYWLIFEEDPEHYPGLIHGEYEKETAEEPPYYEEVEVSALVNGERTTSRSVCESFRRSFHVNFGLLLAVVFLGTITVALVFVDLNTTNSCIEWRHFNRSIPPGTKVLQIVGTALGAFPLYVWFPLSLAMLRGFKEFKINHLSCLFASCLSATMTMLYRALLFDEYTTTTKYRLPDNTLFVLTILICIYLAARKFKKVNPTSDYSLWHIFFCLSFTFMACTVISYIYTYIIIENFKKTHNKITKAMFAALTPGIVLVPTAVGKYLVLRKSVDMISADKAFLTCYFLRGGAIGLYRTMQADFQNIWLFTSLSLLHGVSNVVSKATLNLRVRMWQGFIGYAKKTRCGATLEILPTDTPRIRRFNADLEIQNILFEYTTVILSQAYSVLYVVMNYDVVQPWEVIHGSMIRISISTGIDLICNIVSVFIQIHFYNIPMRRVWFKYWRRHLIANALIIICMVSYFGTPLVSVFEAREDTLKKFKLKNCTVFI